MAALESLPEDAPLLQRILVRHRRSIGLQELPTSSYTLSHPSPGILIPLLFFETCWWCQAVKHDYFSYFPERYLLSITMVLSL